MEEFLQFLSEKCRTWQMLDNRGKEESHLKGNATKRGEKRIALASTSHTCSMCKEAHCLFGCPEFLGLSARDRLAAVKQRQLCVNCLKSGHYAKDCRSGMCRKCSKAHNTLLHVESAESAVESRSTVRSSENGERALVAHCMQNKQLSLVDQKGRTCEVNHVGRKSQVLLSTAQVNIWDGQGHRRTCRALLDPGSQSHLITQRLVNQLQLSRKKATQMVSGIMQSVTGITSSTTIHIESQQSRFKADLECLVIPTITECLPQVQIDRRFIEIPSGCRLADPAFDKPGPVDLLIGAGLFWSLLCVGQVKKAKGHPTWQKTQLGWIVGGELIGGDNITNTFLITNHELNNSIERFWLQEEVPEYKELSKMEKYCEEYFSKTVTRDAGGRYIVRLPRNMEVVIGDSRQLAWRRFHALERRFRKQPSLKEKYVQFMEDYRRQGHMSLMSREAVANGVSCYLPHQPVFRPDSLTTKLRVVFDASAKTDNNKSLNDVVLPGPNLQGDLLHILLRFRTYEYVLTGDIAMMFRQILVAEEDRRFQQILWRSIKYIHFKHCYIWHGVCALLGTSLSQAFG